jgi:PAS domain S-box-containing protein
MKARAKILIVEDEYIIASDLRAKLEQMGFQTCPHVSAGEEVVRQVKSHRPDLVLMDIQLSGAMDGISAAELVRERFSLPVIFLTSFMDREMVERARSCKPHGYLIKPYNELTLQVTIEMALDRARAEIKLLESEERLRMLVESGDDVIAIHDHHGRYLYCHGPKYGFCGESAAGRTLHDLFGEEMGERLAAQIRMVSLTGLTLTVENRLQWEDRELWFSDHLYPIRGKSGRINGVAKISRNINDLKEAEADRERLIAKLKAALEEVKVLSGLLPICANCKRIRDKNGRWEQIESYIRERSEADFSHSICPDCASKLYPEYDL